MYLLTHSLSPILVLVAVMDPKELKTKISHTHSLILSPVEPSGSSPTVTRKLEIHTVVPVWKDRHYGCLCHSE